MKKPVVHIGILAALLLFAACKPQEDIIDPVPYIEIVDVSTTSVKQFEENVTITLSYEDQDGDLGFSDPDSLSLWVTDSRLTEPDEYHIPPLAPEGEELHIRGTVKVNLISPFLLGNGGPETINYTLQLKDRAGNWSNKVISEDIVVTE